MIATAQGSIPCTGDFLHTRILLMGFTRVQVVYGRLENDQWGSMMNGISYSMSRGISPGVASRDGVVLSSCEENLYI